MIQQVPGKIFLADQRGVVQNSHFRRQSTFNFGDFQHEHKGPFGRLYGLNEETLAGGHDVTFSVGSDSCIVLLPITGAVVFSSSSGAHGTVEAGEVLTLSVPAGAELRLRNPYEGELISFLHLWVHAAAPVVQATALKGVFGDLPENELLELVAARAPDQPATPPSLPFRLSLGSFMGRHEATYQVAAGNSLFAFVIAGAFELEGRLLHENDGVALWEVAEIEMEALSNHALILVVELVA